MLLSAVSRGSKNNCCPRLTRSLVMGDSGVAMSLGSGWKSSCARLSRVTSSSSSAVASEIASTAAIPAPLTQRLAIELFICPKFSPEYLCAETEITFAVSIQLLGNLLDLLAFHKRDIGHRFSRIQPRHCAHRAIVAVRLLGGLYGFIEGHAGLGHGFALFLGVFQIVGVRYLLRLFDGARFIIGDDFAEFAGFHRVDG